MSTKWKNLHVENLSYDTITPAVGSSTIANATLKETSCTAASLMALGYNNGTYGLSSLNHGFLSVNTSGAITGNGLGDLYRIAVDPSGNSYIGSFFYFGTITFGSTTLTAPALGYDAFLAKLDNSGTWLWAIQTTHTSSNSNGAIIYSNCVDTSGNSYVAGNFIGTITFGATTLTSSGGSTGDAFISKISPSGSWLWTARSTSSAGGCTPHGIVVDSSGNPYMHCTITSNATFGATTISNDSVAVVKLNPSTGAFTWATASTGSSVSDATDICVDSSNNLFVVGSFNTNIVFGTTTLNAGTGDTYVAKINSSGSWLWALNTSHTGSGNSSSNAIICDANGDAYVVGRYKLNITLGSYTLTTPNNQESFIAKASSSGTWLAAFDPGYQTLTGVTVDSFGNPYSVGYNLSGTRLLTAYNSSLSTQLWSYTPADSSSAYIWVAIDSNNVAYILGTNVSNIITVTKATYPISGSQIVCSLNSGVYNDTISCAIAPMLVTGFSGLVAGSKYYASTTPTPTLTVTSYPVGMANSTTDLIFDPTNPYLA